PVSSRAFPARLPEETCPQHDETSARTIRMLRIPLFSGYFFHIALVVRDTPLRCEGRYSAFPRRSRLISADKFASGPHAPEGRHTWPGASTIRLLFLPNNVRAERGRIGGDRGTQRDRSSSRSPRRWAAPA